MFWPWWCTAAKKVTDLNVSWQPGNPQGLSIFAVKYVEKKELIILFCVDSFRKWCPVMLDSLHRHSFILLLILSGIIKSLYNSEKSRVSTCCIIVRSIKTERKIRFSTWTYHVWCLVLSGKMIESKLQIRTFKKKTKLSSTWLI